MPRGVRLTGQELREIIDLYRWGARMSDICMLYDYNKFTVRNAMAARGVKLRPPRAPAMANPKKHPDNDRVTSTRPTIPVGARIVEDRPTPDQLLRSSAHAQRDRRIAARLSDASTGSYLEEAYECRYAFLRSGNRLPDLE